ncbi:MAG: DUF4417 domain-containing protein [bacterium]|nr:DUF4417 domain-containing protein [bacterium]
MPSKSSKRWRDSTDYWNIKLFRDITYRDKNGIPILRARKDDEIKSLIPTHLYNAGQTKPRLGADRNGYTHFYLDDYQFERFWNFPIRYTNYLKTFNGTLSPDYSVYADYPYPVQVANVFRNRALGAYWAMNGIKVIPSISWNVEKSFEWCFDAVEKDGVVAISTVGSLRTEELKRLLLIGYVEMLNRIRPCKVIVYGTCPEELHKFGVPIKTFKAFHKKFEDSKKVREIK